jgi:ribonuclease HII
MKTATFLTEQALSAEGYSNIIGVDEAGRGPLVGPVVAAAVVPKRPNTLYVLDPAEDLWRFVRDSKTLSEKKREELFVFLHEHFIIGIGIASAQMIDRMNILQATFFAMKHAIQECVRANNSYEDIEKKTLQNETETPGTGSNERIPHKDRESIVLVDGSIEIPNYSSLQVAISKGDSTVKTIAAASIVAKVTRDRLIIELAQTYAHYGFERHKGYGTAEHLAALKKHGPCPEHRRSFGPVKRCLPEHIEEVNRRLA